MLAKIVWLVLEGLTISIEEALAASTIPPLVPLVKRYTKLFSNSFPNQALTTPLSTWDNFVSWTHIRPGLNKEIVCFTSSCFAGQFNPLTFHDKILYY
jgi:hypothetical protein